MSRSAFNAALAARILKLLEQAQPYTEIARTVGISKQTLWRWRQVRAQNGAAPEMVEFARCARSLRPQPLARSLRPTTVYSEALAAQALEHIRQGHTLSASSRLLGFSPTLLSHWAWKSKQQDAPSYLAGFARRVELARIRRVADPPPATIGNGAQLTQPDLVSPAPGWGNAFATG